MSVNRSRLAAGALALATAASLAGAPAVGATAPLFLFNVQVNSECVYLNQGPASVFTTISQLDPAGAPVEIRGITLDSGGSGGVCMAEPFYPGMKVSALVNGTTRTLTVPKLTVKVDRVTDVVSGVAPKGSSLTIQVVHWANYATSATTTVNKTATSTGTYSTDLTSKVNVIGGDRASVTLNYASGDSAGARTMVTSVGVRIGSPKVEAQLGTGETGVVSLKDAAGVLRAKAGLSFSGWDPSTKGLFVAGGSAVSTRVGDKVAAPLGGGVAFTVANLTVTTNVSTNVISGVCQANRALKVLVHNDSPYKSEEFKLVCTSGGTYTLNVTATVDLQTADKVLVTMRLSTGDQVSRQRVA